jgi:CHAT domain-containing protein
MVDDQNPMYSNLAFGKDQSVKEDGYLNTFELFNMKLNARMAVLSACNTGVGALQKGEGIMSLARGFYYAGCPDVVMTLWPVEDKMSSDLVTDFYHQLSEGKSKAEALRFAKLNFLKSADPLRAHPYFWAGYVNIGDNSPLVKQQKESPRVAIAWAGILGLLIVLLPLTWRFLS